MSLILIVNNHIKECGVYQFGKRVGDILLQSRNNEYHYREISSYQEYLALLQKYKYDAIIYNYHPATLGWLNQDTINKRIASYAMYHEETMPSFFDYILNIDPTAPNTHKQIGIPRPLLKTNFTYINSDEIIIGSFGFAFHSKGFHNIVKYVNEQFDNARIRFHMPYAYHAGWTAVPVTEEIKKWCYDNITKPGIKLEITHHFMDENALLEFLSQNTINIFLYDDLGGRGCSSVIDYALSVNRPLAISTSYMFRHIYSDEICLYKTPIADIIKNGNSYSDKFREKWSPQNLIRIIESWITTNTHKANKLDQKMTNNTVLNDRHRTLLQPVVDQLHSLVPDMMARKIARANVQQAFVFKFICDNFKTDTPMLCVGSYEDTCCAGLKKLGYNITEIDPVHNYDMHTFSTLNSESRFPVIFSVSVIEHVQNDDEFIEDICHHLAPNGTCILTCDFNNSYKPGYHKPTVDYRLYTKADLLERFKAILDKHDCYIQGDVDYDEPPDFIYEGSLYTFGTYVFKKREYHI